MTVRVFVSNTVSLKRGESPFCLVDDDAAMAMHETGPDRLISAILPWGTDAVFNRLQVERVLGDLDALIEHDLAAGVKDQLTRLRSFIRENWPDDGHDRYLMFVAD